ncbi:MAG: amidohydrolase family protein [Nocardia sp.]|nr:amidohydrolase family protein [Nocardia sp.]
MSADSHACLPPMMYKQYLESEYHDSFEDYLADTKIISNIVDLLGYPPTEKALDVFDTRGAMSVELGEVGYYDPTWRLRQVEAEGVVAEFLHPFGTIGFTPFVDIMNSPRSHELRAAGSRAHNRFLEEFCSEAPGRLLGVPLIYPWPDWDAAVRDMVRAKETGCYAIYPPTFAGVPGDLPALYDSWWDPMWAAAQDLGLVVHVHASFGNPQGAGVALAEVAFSGATGGEGAASLDAGMLPEFDPDAVDDEPKDSLLAQFFESFTERRPLWQLMWGGVFDRFPKLKVVFDEIHADWVPPTLAYLDAKHAAEPGAMKLTPTEYWKRHCGVGTSLMRYGDVAVRHEIGIEKVMMGTDYPHMEGTWPNTHDWIRQTLGGIPENEARAILGENCIDFYGLDRPLLEKHAKRVGPLVGELFDGRQLDPKLVKHFEFRAGIGKSVNFDEAQMTEAFENDRAGATQALAASGK